jgi:hypothetical protein
MLYWTKEADYLRSRRQGRQILSGEDGYNTHKMKTSRQGSACLDGENLRRRSLVQQFFECFEFRAL